MKFAYADPPYPGQSKRWYGDHPDYAGEVDHAELIARLEADYPDGWALSTDGRSVQPVLALCPPVRVAIWHRTNAAPPGGRAGWHWDWEPVIVRGGRPGPVKTTFSSGQNGAAGRFPGSKPPGFTRWMLNLLGATLEDTIDDLFPGSGIVGREIEAWRRQPTLPTFTRADIHYYSYAPGRLARDNRLSGYPELFD